MKQRKRFRPVALIVSFWLMASCAGRDTHAPQLLSRQSINIVGALESMPGEGDSVFLENFPDSLEEFTRICNSPDFDELYDCHELFFPHMERLSREQPGRVGQILSRLAAVVEYDADAPNYLQKAWSSYCSHQTRDFVEALVSLEDEKRQDRALRYLNAYLHRPDDRKLLPCISSLESSGFDDWADRARSHLHEREP